MKRLENLPQIAQRQLGGLEATPKILAKAKLQAADMRTSRKGSMMLRPILAVCAALVLCVGAAAVFTGNDTPLSAPAQINVLDSHSAGTQVLPTEVPRADAVYNISHGAMVLKALELGDEKLLRNAMQDKLHQPYRKKLIGDYEAIESLVRTAGAAFCISGAGPTLLCITMDPKLEEKLGKKLASVTTANWQMIPLHIDFKGAHIIE